MLWIAQSDKRCQEYRLTSSNRLVGSCHKKCIAPDDAHRYHEGDLLKGEAVCIDRCTAKFFEVSPSILELRVEC
jgi:hypothetical protein